MKTVLTSIITSIITVIVALLVVYAIWGDDDCKFNDDNDNYRKECAEKVKKDHNYRNEHAMCMEKFEDLREEFDAQLSQEEKETIEAISEKFEDAHCEEMCPEGKKKFMEEHKADFEALLAIADNHKEFFDGLYAEMHKEHEKTGVKAEDVCPEAKTCREATEKCKGETKEIEKKADPEKTAPAQAEEKKCKEAKEACEEACFDTFKIHFLLMDED